MTTFNETKAEITTKADARSEKVVTNLTIDWTGMSADDVQALAQQALVVKLQSAWRANGIPAGEHTVKASDHKIGVRAPRKPVDVKKALETYIADQINSGKSREAVIRELMAAAKFNDANA